MVKPQGVLIVDSTLITQRSNRDDIRELDLPAKDIGAELGFPQIANVVMIGALVAATGVLKIETLEKILDEHLGERHRAALEPNKLALRRGAEYGLQKETA